MNLAQVKNAEHRVHPVSLCSRGERPDAGNVKRQCALTGRSHPLQSWDRCACWRLARPMRYLQRAFREAWFRFSPAPKHCPRPPCCRDCREYRDTRRYLAENMRGLRKPLTGFVKNKASFYNNPSCEGTRL